LVKNSIIFNIISTSPTKHDLTQVEFLICEVTLNHTKILIAVIYRRPERHCKFEEFFNELQKHTPTHADIILLGDFNINLIF
jgi:hypothetical protein